LLKCKRPVDARQAIWDEIRQWTGPNLGAIWFGPEMISRDLKIPEKTVRSYFDCLLSGEIITRGEDGLFALVRNAGQHAPRLRADGTPVDQGKGRAGAWRAMRVLKRFTTREIHNASGAAATDVKSFLTYLNRAGYVRIVANGKGRAAATYQLIKNTGPKPPQVTRVKCIYDPNLGAVTWPTATIEAESVVEGSE
jgi:hypothetical protein